MSLEGTQIHAEERRLCFFIFLICVIGVHLRPKSCLGNGTPHFAKNFEVQEF
jgi:hypothetical protein